jgi:hypothetical protein
MISSSLRSIQDSVSASGNVDFFVNIDFFRDDFFSSYIEGFIRRGTIREPRNMVCNYFNNKTS